MQWILKNKLLLAVGAVITAFFLYSNRKNSETYVTYSVFSGTYCLSQTGEDNEQKVYFVIDKSGNFIIYNRDSVMEQGKLTHNVRQKKITDENGLTVYYKENYKIITVEKGREIYNFEKISDILIYINAAATRGENISQF